MNGWAGSVDGVGGDMQDCSCGAAATAIGHVRADVLEHRVLVVTKGEGRGRLWLRKRSKDAIGLLERPNSSCSKRIVGHNLLIDLVFNL